MTRRLATVVGLGTLGAALLFSAPAHAASVGMGEWSFSAHLTGALIDEDLVSGAELALGIGIVPRVRLEIVGSALLDFDQTREFMAGARPLVRLGGLLGDVELGATAYASFGGATSLEDELGFVVGPHLRWTFAVLSVFYEPLFFTNTQFGDIDLDADDVAAGAAVDLRDSKFVPLRTGVGVQF